MRYAMATAMLAVAAGPAAAETAVPATAGEPVTIIRYSFDERGVPQNCEIAVSSGSANKDAQACRLWTKRARIKTHAMAELKPGVVRTQTIRWEAPD